MYKLNGYCWKHCQMIGNNILIFLKRSMLVNAGLKGVLLCYFKCLQPFILTNQTGY